MAPSLTSDAIDVPSSEYLPMAAEKRNAKPAGTEAEQEAEQLRKSVVEFLKYRGASKEGALEFLVATGTHTPSGRLKKPYK